MKRAILLLSLLLPLTGTAQNVIHRCLGKDGSPVYSDQPCTAVGATSLAPPPATSVAASADGAPTAGMLCAKDLGELREGLARAFASHDPNRIGALVLWNGYGSAGAVERLRQLDGVVRQPVLSIRGDEADGLDVVTGGPSGDPSSRHVRFGVARDSGCLWLRPPG